MNRIVIEKPPKKKGFPFLVGGAAFLVLAALVIWVMQFRVAVNQGLFADFSEEFTQTSEQIQAGLELMETTTIIPETPEALYEQSTQPKEVIDQKAQEALSNQLPISE